MKNPGDLHSLTPGLLPMVPSSPSVWSEPLCQERGLLDLISEPSTYSSSPRSNLYDVVRGGWFSGRLAVCLWIVCLSYQMVGSWSTRVKSDSPAGPKPQGPGCSGGSVTLAQTESSPGGSLTLAHPCPRGLCRAHLVDLQKKLEELPLDHKESPQGSVLSKWLRELSQVERWD